MNGLGDKKYDTTEENSGETGGELRVTFDNVNENGVIEVLRQDGEISGTISGVSSGAEVVIRVNSTDASEAFRMGGISTVNSGGEFSHTFDFSEYEVGDEFENIIRFEGNELKREDSIIVSR